MKMHVTAHQSSLETQKDPNTLLANSHNKPLKICNDTSKKIGNPKNAFE